MFENKKGSKFNSEPTEEGKAYQQDYERRQNREKHTKILDPQADFDAIKQNDHIVIHKSKENSSVQSFSHIDHDNVENSQLETLISKEHEDPTSEHSMASFTNESRTVEPDQPDQSDQSSSSVHPEEDPDHELGRSLTPSSSHMSRVEYHKKLAERKLERRLNRHHKKGHKKVEGNTNKAKLSQRHFKKLPLFKTLKNHWKILVTLFAILLIGGVFVTKQLSQKQMATDHVQVAKELARRDFSHHETDIVSSATVEDMRELKHEASLIDNKKQTKYYRDLAIAGTTAVKDQQRASNFKNDEGRYQVGLTEKVLKDSADSLSNSTVPDHLPRYYKRSFKKYEKLAKPVHTVNDFHHQVNDLYNHQNKLKKSVSVKQVNTLMDKVSKYMDKYQLANDDFKKLQKAQGKAKKNDEARKNNKDKQVRPHRPSTQRSNATVQQPVSPTTNHHEASTQSSTRSNNYTYHDGDAVTNHQPSAEWSASQSSSSSSPSSNSNNSNSSNHSSSDVE